MSEQITIKFKYSDLTNPVRKDFLLEKNDNEIIRKEISPIMKKLFVDAKSLTFAFDIGTCNKTI